MPTITAEGKTFEVAEGTKRSARSPLSINKIFFKARLERAETLEALLEGSVR